MGKAHTHADSLAHAQYLLILWSLVEMQPGRGRPVQRPANYAGQGSSRAASANQNSANQNSNRPASTQAEPVEQLPADAFPALGGKPGTAATVPALRLPSLHGSIAVGPTRIHHCGLCMIEWRSWSLDQSWLHRCSCI